EGGPSPTVDPLLRGRVDLHFPEMITIRGRQVCGPPRSSKIPRRSPRLGHRRRSRHRRLTGGPLWPSLGRHHAGQRSCSEPQTKRNRGQCFAAFILKYVSGGVLPLDAASRGWLGV
ncbi:hypothetical protein H1C71_032796, partial [Ictidomys tridecemlineatus]